MRSCFITLVLFFSLSSLATTGIICRDDQRMEKGALRELILSEDADGYHVQTQYIPTLNSTEFNQETWLSKFRCRLDDKSPVALCTNEDGTEKLSVTEKRQVFFDSMDESSKKKNERHIDISLYENGDLKKSEQFNINDCQTFGAQA